MMKLYSFFRSGTSHRLRIALALKGISFETIAIDLRKDEHLGETFRNINPQGFVPALVDGSLILTQSPALLEWLEDTHPEPALLPRDPVARARVRALAAIVGCDIHPINNRRILNRLRAQFGADEAALNAWCGQWIGSGFDAYSALLDNHAPRGDFSWGHAHPGRCLSGAANRERPKVCRGPRALATPPRYRAGLHGAACIRPSCTDDAT